MSNRRAFEIAFVGLKPGEHVFEYQINDSFFEPYGLQDFEGCHTRVKLTLIKENSFLQLKFDVDGFANVQCDRCSNPLKKQLWDEFNIVVKLVENPDLMNEQEEDPDIYYISRGESHIYVADWIFEFINLSLPMTKMCAEEERGGDLCNKEVLHKLEQMEQNILKEASPIWKGLDKINGLD